MHEITKEDLEMVRRIAFKVKVKHGLSFDIDDIIAAGNLGLVKAAKRYDPSRGSSFKTYYSYRVRGEMIDYMRKAGHGGRYRPENLEMVEFEEHQAAEYPPDDIWIDIENVEMTNKDKSTLKKILAGEKLQDIADIDGVTESAVSSRYKRATDRIRDAISA